MSGSIFAKINAVMQEIMTVPKNGVNTHFNYKYVKEEDLLDMIRPLLIKHGLAYLPPNVIEQQRNGEFTKVNMEFTLGDVETGETLKSTFWGEGQDKNDKGLYKAYTGATKYFLMKTFLIPTNDDAEADPKDKGKGNNRGNNGQPPNQGNNRGNTGQPPNQGNSRGNTGQPQNQGKNSNPAPDIYTGKIKLTGDADVGSEMTPKGMMPYVKIYGITMDNRPVLCEGWGSEMLPLMADLVAGQTLMIQGAKTKLNAQHVLRIGLNVSNFSVTNAA